MGQADIFNPFVSPLPPATVCIPLASFESVWGQILRAVAGRPFELQVGEPACEGEAKAGSRPPA